MYLDVFVSELMSSFQSVLYDLPEWVLDISG